MSGSGLPGVGLLLVGCAIDGLSPSKRPPMTTQKAVFRDAKHGLLGANPYLIDVQPFTNNIFTNNDTLYKTAPL